MCKAFIPGTCLRLFLVNSSQHQKRMEQALREASLNYSYAQGLRACKDTRNMFSHFPSVRDPNKLFPPFLFTQKTNLNSNHRHRSTFNISSKCYCTFIDRNYSFILEKHRYLPITARVRDAKVNQSRLLKLSLRFEITSFHFYTSLKVIN